MALVEARSKVAEQINDDWLNGPALAFIFLLVAGILGAYDLVMPVLHPAAPLLGLTAAGWVVIVGLIIAAYISVSWARGAALWATFIGGNSHKKVKRDEPNPFSELFIYLILALISLAGTCFYFKIDEIWQAAAITGGLVCAFLPPLYWFMKLARQTYGKDYEPDHISTQSVLIGFVVISLIGGLAWAAGSGRIPQNHPFFGIWILSFVLALFLLFIVAPYVYALSQRNQRNTHLQAQGFSPSNPVGAISAFDGFLVRSLAPLTGAIQTRKGSFSLLPHLLLILIFLPLTALGFAMPAPYGLVPIGLAALLAIALGRRWAWVEDDRETAMRIHKIRDKNIRIGFLNDLRDEALLGYAFLFMLIPLALRQLQMSFGFFEGGSGDSVFDWVQFFGIELAKGVPIVDWADIYGVSPQAPFEHPNDSALSRHLVFGSRLMVDIVIIAALLQAWGIVRRNADQLKLFKDGQLDMLDPFVEEARFKKGVTKNAGGALNLTPDLTELFEEHAKGALSRNNRRMIPYDEQRLTELLASKDKKLVFVAKYLTREYSLLVGSTHNQIEILSSRFYNEKNKLRGNDDSQWLSDQRYAFESLLRRANRENVRLNAEYIQKLRAMVDEVAEEPAFFDAKVMAYELLGRQKTKYGIYALSSALGTINEVGPTNTAEWSFKREKLQETRETVIRGVEHLCTNTEGDRPVASETIKMGRALLKWAAENETNKPKAAARAAIRRLDATS